MTFRARWARMLLVALAVAAAGACAAEYPQSALHPRSDFATLLDDLFRGIVWWALLVYVVVQGLIFYVIFRFRAREGDPRPRAVHGHTWLEVGWTLAPALILVAIAVPTVRAIFVVDQPPEDEALVVEVVGKQWWWEFRYPEQGIVTANEAHVPVGRTVQFLLRSDDVIHSFWVPRLGGKRDVVPGRENQIWLTPDSAGVYWGQCAEYCGVAHALMGLRVVVEEPAAFEAWVEAQREPAAEPAREDTLAVQGRELFQRSVCIGCHRVRGTPAAGVVGPDLTHFGSRRTLAAGMAENTSENLRRWIADPQGMKPGNLMPEVPLTDEQVERLVAYLMSLR